MPKRSDRPGERRTRLNRERVLDAGIALADDEGIGALSMRRLGKELGVEGMALYNHVKNKDDLLDGMLDRVADEVDLPDPGPEPMPEAGLSDVPGVVPLEVEPSEGRVGWRGRARTRAISAHATFLRHPWSASLWTSSISVGPARMRYLDSALCDLRKAGFAPGLLDRAFHTIENHIVGHAMQALGFAVDHDDMEAMSDELLRSFPAGRYPDLAAHIRYHVDGPRDDDAFEFGLDLILDGLESLRASGGATPR